MTDKEKLTQIDTLINESRAYVLMLVEGLMRKDALCLADGINGVSLVFLNMIQALEGKPQMSLAEAYEAGKKRAAELGLLGPTQPKADA